MTDEWSTGRKILFRTVFCYFLLYIFPFPLDLLPFGLGDQIATFVSNFWEGLATWIGTNIFNIKELPNWRKGSGDRTLDYLVLFMRLIISILIVIIWSLLDLRKKEYDRLKTYLLIYLRYFLAITLMTYGFSKLFVNQFWEPSLYDLLKPYGESSPMGLLWKFMGYSKTYTIFTGICEVSAALFLLFRPTIRLGSIIGVGAMLNVFMLNISYDVPVKLFSFHLLLIGTIIFVGDFKNFINFFILNRPTAETEIIPYFETKKWNILGRSMKVVFIMYFVLSFVQEQMSYSINKNQSTFTDGFYGIYDVDRFVLKNDTLPPLTSDSIRWKSFIIEKRNGLIIRMDEKKYFSKINIDTIAKLMAITPYLDTTEAYNLRYNRGKGTLLLFGEVKGDSVQIDLKQRSEGFYLLQRKFNWINEFPMNR